MSENLKNAMNESLNSVFADKQSKHSNHVFFPPLQCDYNRCIKSIK